ncbi:unnamed protein product, partial [marine sediment metagenome]
KDGQHNMGANGQIVSFEEPTILEAGQKYYLRNKVKNVGDLVGNFTQRYVLLWENRELTSSPLTLNPGEVGTYVFIAKAMPNEDAVFDIYVERNGAQDDYHRTVIKLGYGEPHITIQSIDFPESQVPLSSVEVNLTLENTGSTSAFTAMRMNFHWLDKETTTKWEILNPNDAATGRITFPMPHQDATLTISFIRLHNSIWVTDDSKTITIKKEEAPLPPPPPPPTISVGKTILVISALIVLPMVSLLYILK